MIGNQLTDKIGIIWPDIPTLNELEEVELFVPDMIGIEIVCAKDAAKQTGDISLQTVLKKAHPALIAEAALEFSHQVVGIGYACTSVSYVRGIEGASEIEREISVATGLPATTTSTAMSNALRRLEVERVGVLSPHVDELNDKLVKFINASGFTVSKMVGMGRKKCIDEIPDEEISDLVMREVDSPDSEAIFISCTSMKTSSIIENLEDTLNKPVVTANQVTVWEAICLGGLELEENGLGILMRKY